MKLFNKIILIIALFVTPLFCYAASTKPAAPKDEIFQAEVVKILKQETHTLSDGTNALQQDVKLMGLDNDFKNKFVTFYGIGDIDVVKKNLYKVGDTVLVSAAYNDTGMASYYITDYVRTKSLKILFFLFVAILLIVGRWKGFRSMLALSISFFVILKFIVPKIIAGSNPILITLIGSLIIFIASIYITEGFSKISHIAIVSVTISLAITIFLSWLFVELSKLSGLANEEAGSLIMVGQNMLNFKGLLLAGIIIGALGVLDDVVISQAATVEEIHRTDPGLSKKALFERAFRVGLSHISSMTNTLFLAYAGVSLPLIILFTTGQSAMNSYAQIINNEDIATEIVRTLAASVGLILAVPIATFVAVWWFKKGQQTTKNISH